MSGMLTLVFSAGTRSAGHRPGGIQGGIRGITLTKESELVKAVAVEWLIDVKRADTKCETNGRIDGQTYK